jgi:hypothetical protein
MGDPLRREPPVLTSLLGGWRHDTFLSGYVRASISSLTSFRSVIERGRSLEMTRIMRLSRSLSAVRAAISSGVGDGAV